MRFLRLDGLPPASRSILIISSWQLDSMARSKGVPHLSNIIFTSAPTFTSISTISLSPFRTAVCDESGLRTQANIEVIQLRLACAQDDAGRDVMLKLVDKDSDQYRISQELMRDQAIFRDYSTFPCVLPPTRILDSTPHQYAIVAMPM